MKGILLGLTMGLALRALAGNGSLVTATLQTQIDDAAAKGGGRVVVASGVHRTGLLRLRSNVTLEVPADAELSGSNDLSDYGVDPKDRHAIFALVVAENATNVAIVGSGTINGNGGEFPEGDMNPNLPRPRLLYFHNCRNVRLEGVTLRNPAMWTCYFRQCLDVTARRVTIRSQANHNNDGFDIDARRVLIEGCDIDSLDDAVCFKSDDPDFVVGDAEVCNCTLASCSSAVKFGTSSYCAFRNISIHDCIIKPTKTSPILDWSRPGNWWGLGLAGVTNRISGVSGLSLEAVDGGSLENVTARNLTIKGYHTAIFMRQAERNVHPSGRPGVFRNVLVENVKAETVSSYANSITGTPGHRPSGITLRNVEIVCRGGGTVVNTRYPVPERPWAYPENRCLGPLPAWGFYVRHADDVRFENVRLSLSAPDARDPVVVEDSTGVRTNGIVAVEHPEKPGVQYVDPMIGCAKDGHTYPGPTCPFGLVQPGPDSGNGDWAHCSGYVNADDRIYGFSQTHLSGTGCPDFGDVRLLPFMDQIADDASEDELYALKDLYGLKAREKVSEAYDDWSSGEMAQVGLYRVDLTNLYSAVSVTAGRRTAFYRFQKRNFGKFHLLVDPQWGQLWLGRRIEDHILSYSDRIDEDRMGLCGSFRHKGWLDRTVHFKIRFSRPFSRLRKLPSKGGEKASRYVLDFDDVFRFHNVEATIALSCETPEGAERNFAAEAPMGFDGARMACVAAWERALSAVKVSGATRAQRTSFYTSLYHLMIQPNLVTDVDETPRYSTFSLWDTFRAAHPLYTILVPDRAAEFANSLLASYRRNGFLPVWEGGGDENFCMIGNHAVPVVADVVLKGLPGVDRALAYEAVTNSLTVTHRCADGREKPKEDWGLLNRYGYYPFDLIEGEGVSRTLECAYDDACAMRLAKLTGDSAGEAFFAHRAGNWTNVLDRSIGLVRGKDTRGCWREPFDPLRFGGGGEWDQYDCTEANAWQYTWHVLHDPQGLIAALGGRDRFLAKLDELFVQPLEKDGWAVKRMTGRIGQYVHGNEPSHHIPYLYALVGRPDRTAEIVREVCDRFYLPRVDGLCGNDDCGQMSAWYVFAALGFYPFDPCGGEYVIGAPQVPKAQVNVKGEGERWNSFTVVARGLSKENKYVKSVMLNGKPITDWKIRHEDIVKGGELVFEMMAK